MINLYYDHITEHGPVPNGCDNYSWEYTKTKKPVPYIKDKIFKNVSMIQRVSMFYYTMIAQNCKVNLKTGKEKGNDVFYPIELSFHNRTNICSLIQPKSLKRLVKGNIKTLLLYQEEGADYYTMHDVKRVADDLAKAGVDPSDIYIVLGDLNCVYKKFFDPYKIYGIDWWQIKHQLTSKSRQGIEDYHWTSLRTYDTFANEKVLDLDKDIRYKKTFLCFNGNNRYHRAGLVSELIYRNLNNDGYVSYNIYGKPTSHYSSTDERIVSTKKGQEYVNRKSEIIEYINNNKMVIDYQDITFFKDDRRFDPALYYKSAISLVTETFAAQLNSAYFDEAHVLWTTEKTWKPIALGHPFMILGSLNTMTYLQSEGYYTYYDIINESYDRVTDLPTRIDMICDELERLSKISKKELKELTNSVKDIAIHNREKFYNKNHADKFYKLFKELVYGQRSAIKF